MYKQNKGADKKKVNFFKMTVNYKNTPVYVLVTCRDVIPAAEELAQNELKSILKEHFFVFVS